MKFIRDQHDKVAPLFEKGGKLEKLYPVWEAHDTLLFTPGEVTKGTTHIRDGLDLKRMMITVVIALLPCVGMALYNTGYQANYAIANMGAAPLDVWQSTLFSMIPGLAHDPTSVIANLLYGALFFVPIWLFSFAVGGIIEVVFAVVRNHEVNEGFLVTGFLFPLTLPPTMPLWQAALGIAFGVIIGKEIFGGTGMNILNPALTGRAFLFFAYPADISGDSPWIAADMSAAKMTSTLDTVGADAVSGATWLGKASTDAATFAGKEVFGADWMQAFIGLVPGSMGETSALACLLGAAILIFAQIGSWRTMAGVVRCSPSTMMDRTSPSSPSTKSLNSFTPRKWLEKVPDSVSRSAASFPNASELNCGTSPKTTPCAMQGCREPASPSNSHRSLLPTILR